ncbi:MAG: hypothetical protein IT311_08515 [Anaerolineales bacterium]|nr:hypothetical protein [Anaerolineales bacterium]MCZ2123396.1 hypothetical protein [Anaerolineales bacterium]
MSFLQKLFSGATSSSPKRNYYVFTVKCKRCGETIEGRIDLNNDLSVEYEGDTEVYYSRKTLMGGGKCFQRIEAEFKFSANRSLVEQQARGGDFILP